jgi:hypothetical protein
LDGLVRRTRSDAHVRFVPSSSSAAAASSTTTSFPSERPVHPKVCVGVVTRCRLERRRRRRKRRIGYMSVVVHGVRLPLLQDLFLDDGGVVGVVVGRRRWGWMVVMVVVRGRSTDV